MDILNNLTGAELMDAIERRDVAKLNKFVARVTANGRDKVEYLDSWFQENAVYVGQMERQF